MADIDVTPEKVGAWSDKRQDIFSGLAGGEITQGYFVAFDGTSGKLVLADATTTNGLYDSVGMALNSTLENQAVDYVAPGIVDGGFDLSGLDYGARVYLSMTPGRIADAPPGVGGTEVIVGHVIGLSDRSIADGKPTKALKLVQVV